MSSVEGMYLILLCNAYYTIMVYNIVHYYGI